jgi:outer membrane protein assembly factor BamB
MAKKQQLLWILGAGVLVLLVSALCVRDMAIGQVAVLVPAQLGPVVQLNSDPPPKTAPATSMRGYVDLTTNSDYSDYLEVAKDCIKDGAWKDAAKAMQQILASEEDYYVRVVDTNQATGNPVERWASVKYEANKLLSSMPVEGLKVYEAIYGRDAEIDLDAAKKSGDVQKLAETAQKYFHTKAGLQANDMLATYFLDRGQFFQASLLFDRVLTLSTKEAKVAPLTLFKAAIAFRRAGDNKRSDDLFNQLKPQLEMAGGLKIGKQLVALDALTKMLESRPSPQLINPKDWTLVRGNLTNTAQTMGSQPLLSDVLWKRSTVRDRFELTGDLDPDGGVKGLIDEAVKRTKELKGVPLMPGFFPLAVEGKLLYRTYSGMVAVNLQDVKDDKGKVIEKSGEISWKGFGFDGSLAKSLTNAKVHGKLNEFITYFKTQPEFMSFIYENSLVGTMSADLKQVYTVDDIAVPVPPHFVQQLFGGNPMFGIPALPPDIRDAMLQNNLQAFNIQTGKNVWALGPADQRKPKHGNFKDSHFLGAPLPVGGKLYVLNEKADGDLRLLAIDPVHGIILSEQKLGNVKTQARFVRDPNRRVHTVHLGYGEGILVCPTNCGQVLGIDLLSKSLAWAYPYREGKEPPTQPVGPIGFPQPQPMPITPSTWKVAPPAIAEGKVVFTAPDAQSLHCINLRDGTQVWRRTKTPTDLFMAGVWDNKVVIVGRNTCYARDLHTGDQVWEVITDSMPSGQGVCSKNIYYLPLDSGEICAIDVTKGSVTRNRPHGNTVVPGNLVFHEGLVLSQTLEEIVAYPQLTAKMELVQAQLKNTPNDLNAMLLLGELSLANGDVKKAVELVYEVKKKAPADLLAKVEQKQYDALTDLFQVDFKYALPKYEKDYEALIKKLPGSDTDKQQREATWYRLLGSGLELMDDVGGAFDAYSKFAFLPLYQTQGVPAKDDPLRKIPAQVWFRGRMAALWEKAVEIKKIHALEEKIDQQWAAINKSKDLNKVRGFVAMFDTTFPVGREARLQLANAIIDGNQQASFLEAELNLEQVRARMQSDAKAKDAQKLAALALEGLARLELKKQSMQLAADYYRQLKDQYPDVVVRDGKTAKAIFDELATDKTILPYLEGSRNPWSGAKFRYKEPALGSVAVANPTGVLYYPKGDLNPDTAQLRLVLEPITYQPKLRLVELSSYKDLWAGFLDAQETNSQLCLKLFSQQFGGNANMHSNAHFRQAFVKGHLAVIQVGTMAYALDLSKQGILWKHSLMKTPITPQQMQNSTVTVDAHGHMDLTLKTLIPQFGQWKTEQARVGYVAAVEASYVALVQETDLVVIDPLSDKIGKVLWTRANISEDTEVFGDDQYIYLVDVVNGVASNGRAVRASDGTAVTIPDFAAVYQKRLHQLGSRIVATGTNANREVVLRLYDIPSGKDLWRAEYPIDTVVLKTTDPYLAGVIEPSGKLTVIDLKTRQTAMQANVLQGRVTKAYLKNMIQPVGKEAVRPLLLADRDHFYVALNQPIDPNVINGAQLHSNFGIGTRCELVNGWFGAFYRHDGAKKGDNAKTWKKGDLHWFASEPVANQLVVVENFDQLPLLMFSAHYSEKLQGVGLPPFQLVSRTFSLDKATGKWVYYPFTPRVIQSPSPSFQVLTVDPKAGTVNMIGFTYILQHYVDDGRLPQVGMADNPPVIPPAVVNPAPALPAEWVTKIKALTIELILLEKKTGQPQSTTLQVPGHGQIILRSGTPPTITFPGQQPVPLNVWLKQMKQK